MENIPAFLNNEEPSLYWLGLITDFKEDNKEKLRLFV
jgi:hypothetical protein